MVEVDDDGDCNSADAIFVNLPKQSSSETPEQSVSESQSASSTPSTPASHTPEESVKGGHGGPGGGDLPNTSTGGSAWTAGWGALLLVSAMALFVTRRRGEVRAR
jgi:LPXTG-motif cell wall-anchored protein